jgi:pyroglutamyl-peptidase
VRYRAAGDTLLRLVRETRPRAIVMLGLAPGREKISLETVAMNLDHCEDSYERRWRRPIVRGGPFTRPSRLPVDRLHRRLRAARIPVALSHHAGTFVCNHVFYLALARTRVACGFIHVPPVEAMPLREQIRAVKLILDAV